MWANNGKAEKLDSEGAGDANPAVLTKFYGDVKFADCLLSIWEEVEIVQRSYCEELVLIAVCFVTTMGVMIKCGLF